MHKKSGCKIGQGYVLALNKRKGVVMKSAFEGRGDGEATIEEVP